VDTSPLGGLPGDGGDLWGRRSSSPAAHSTGRGRACKSHDWDALDRLHAKGYISDPKSKAKSVVLSEEGERLARELFERSSHFGRKG